MGISRKIFLTISNVLNPKKVYLTMSLTYRGKKQKLAAEFDHIRCSTLELCSEEILSNKVEGNVAELGVYKGDFAKKLNQLFPDRKLYLFDTFQGFEHKDIDVEKANNFSDGTQDFSDTSVDLVLNKMLYPNNCIVKKGFFPETAVDVSDKFCFVSLDADLYEPIYQGLKFFYDKLERGGYIFVHDYNNDNYTGAKEAVQKFCKETNISFTPIGDSGGTSIITK